MEDISKLTDLQKKIHFGLQKVKEKLIADKKRNNGSIAIMKDGKVFVYKP